MRIRKKPQKPERLQNQTYNYPLICGSCLQNVLDWAAEYGVLDPCQIYFKCTYGFDEIEYEATIQADEPDKHYNTRLEKYKAELERYENWYNKNKNDIERELEKRRIAAEEKEKQQAAREVKALRAKKKKLEKELTKTKRQLGEK